MTPISASAMYHRMFEAMTASQLVHPHSFEQVKDSLDGAVFHMWNYVTFIKNRAEVVVRTDECDSVLTMSELKAGRFKNAAGDVLTRHGIKFVVSWPLYGSCDVSHARDMQACLAEALAFVEKVGEITIVESLLVTAAEARANKIKAAYDTLESCFIRACEAHFARKRKIGLGLNMNQDDFTASDRVKLDEALDILSQNNVASWRKTFKLALNGSVDALILLDGNKIWCSAKKVA